jgi:RimJ/RimL family protein N-acetyltransferase
VIWLDVYAREQAIEAGWLAYRERLQWFTRDQWQASCAPWFMFCIKSGGEPIGAAFLKDGKVHIGIVPEWRGRWASRRLIREILSFGTETTLLKSETQQREFVLRAFKVAGVKT